MGPWLELKLQQFNDWLEEQVRLLPGRLWRRLKRWVRSHKRATAIIVIVLLIGIFPVFMEGLILNTLETIMKGIGPLMSTIISVGLLYLGYKVVAKKFKRIIK